MRKELKKWGNSLIISFDKEEQKVYKLTAGKILDIEDKSMKVI